MMKQIVNLLQMLTMHQVFSLDVASLHDRQYWTSWKSHSQDLVKLLQPILRVHLHNKFPHREFVDSQPNLFFPLLLPSFSLHYQMQLQSLQFIERAVALYGLIPLTSC